MVGGVLFNFLLALFIYSMILFAWGDQYIKVQEAPLGMDFNETAKAVGFQDGDILLSADNVPFVRYDGDMLSQIADAREVSVLREGKKGFCLHSRRYDAATDGGQRSFCFFPFPVCD